MQKQHYRSGTYRAKSSVGYLVKRAHALMHDNLEPAFAEKGFTFMQWVVLMYLRDGIALNPKHICAEFRHDSGALTRVLDQLEKRGLVVRQRSTQDRRAIELTLTADGRKTVESLVPVVVDKLNWSLRDFSGSEVAELTRLLGKLIEAMQDESPMETSSAGARA